MGKNFIFYSIATVTLLLATVLNAARINRGQYFGTVVYLTNLPSFGVLLTNGLIWLVLMFGKLMTKIFFGDLTLLERQKGVERFFLCLTESVLAMAYLQFVGYSALRLFLCSLFLRVFHSLGRYRHETIEQSAQPLAGKTIRLTALMFILFTVDVFSVYHFSMRVAVEGFGMGLIFLLDYSLMALSAIGTLVKVYINQCSKSGAGNAAEKYHATKFYVNVALSVSASLLHIAFFASLFMYTVPIHLIRDLIMNLSETAANCRHLINYRRLSANIDRVLADATPEQLANNKECAICYDDMVEGTKCKALPCSHVFHRQCLLRWFEKQTACAYCGKDVKKLFQNAGGAAPRPQPPQPAAAAPPAVAGAPAGGQQPNAGPAGAAAVIAPPSPPPQQQQAADQQAAAHQPIPQAPLPMPTHADLDGLTDEELERELHKLVAEFAALAERNPPQPQMNNAVPVAGRTETVSASYSGSTAAVGARHHQQQQHVFVPAASSFTSLPPPPPPTAASLSSPPRTIVRGGECPTMCSSSHTTNSTPEACRAGGGGREKELHNNKGGMVSYGTTFSLGSLNGNHHHDDANSSSTSGTGSSYPPPTPAEVTAGYVGVSIAGSVPTLGQLPTNTIDITTDAEHREGSLAVTRGGGGGLSHTGSAFSLTSVPATGGIGGAGGSGSGHANNSYGYGGGVVGSSSTASTSVPGGGGFPPIIPVDMSSPSQSAFVGSGGMNMHPYRQSGLSLGGSVEVTGGAGPLPIMDWNVMAGGDPVVLAQQLSAYHRFAMQSRAALEELERTLAKINNTAAQIHAPQQQQQQQPACSHHQGRHVPVVLPPLSQSPISLETNSTSNDNTTTTTTCPNHSHGQGQGQPQTMPAPSLTQSQAAN